MSISEKTGQQLSITEGNRALQLFTDRHELTKLFAEYLNDDKPPCEKILLFHGDGGNGKSLLLKFLLENCCKRFPADIWQQLKAKPPAEVADFIQNVTDWECDFKQLPAVLHDFDEQPIGDNRPQDRFYGLLMLQRRLVSAAHHQGYKLHFPLYEFACAWYLKQKGKLTPEHINKLFFPTEELFLLGGITNILSKTVNPALPLLLPIIITLTAQVISFFKKHKSGDLTVGYLRGRGLKEEDLEKILQLNPDKELIDELPTFLAADLNVAMQKPNAPKRVVLFFDTHEAFWGDWRNRGDARFFKQDEWLRRLLAQLKLSYGIVVVVAGREKPRWAEASRWPISKEKLDTQLVWHLKAADAQLYLQRVGIEEDQLRESLITFASVESEQVHPLFIGLCADVVLAAKEQGETLTSADFQTVPQVNQKFNVLIERLLKYVDEDVRDAVDALSACRAFNSELYIKLGQKLNFNTTNASFRLLTRFSFVWQAEQQGQDWYRIHPLVRRLNVENSQKMTQRAHAVLEQHYREQGNVAEAIYHAICQNWQRGVKEWLEVFKSANQQGNNELCRILQEIRKELSF